MPRVELIHDADCPNVDATRDELQRAFDLAGLAPAWREWDRAEPAAPAYVAGYGSPTVLVDGRDVAGAEPDAEGASCCRLYADGAAGRRGTPPAEVIAAALRAAAGRPGSRTGAGPSVPATPTDAGASPPTPGRASSGAAVLGVAAAALPVGACPACWPAYAGVLSALGLGPVLTGRYALPVTAALLLVSAGALAWRAPRRRGYGPFWLGSAASAAVLAGKFAAASAAFTWGGVAVLVAAAAWNAWPRRTACPACGPAPSPNPEVHR